MRDPHPIRTKLAAIVPVCGALRKPVAFALPMLAIVLAACTATKSGQTITAPRTISPAEAMILPAPGGPTVLSVIEERFSDGVEQKVVLSTEAANEGQNYLSIRIYGPMERAMQGRKKLGYRAFTTSAIRGEIAREVPGVAMRVSDLFLRNSYGPFGYAYGTTSAGDACIFGWQQLRSPEADRSNFRNTGAVQVRLRLCERGASEKELLSVMYGYTVTGSFVSEQWNPFGRPRDATATVGTTGEPIYPRDSELESNVTTSTIRRVERPVVVQETTEEKPAARKVIAGEDDVTRPLVRVPAPVDDETIDGPAAGDPAEGAKVIVPSPG